MFQTFLYYFTKLDIYGRNVELYINSQTKVRSKLGAFLSLMIFSLSFYILIQNFKSWYNNEKLQVISSSQSYSVAELLNNNKNLEYNLNNENYNLYFVLTAVMDDGNVLKHDELTKYFTQHFIYINSTPVSQEYELKKCIIREQRDYLDQNYDDLSDLNETSPWQVCLSTNITMGIYVDAKSLLVNNNELIYQIKTCDNATNNNICASDEEIAIMLKKVQIQISFPKSIYDFNEVENPRKRTYDYKFYHLDSNIIKLISATLIPVYLETDKGIIVDDYHLDSLDYNIDNLQYETMTRTLPNENLLKIDLTFAYNQQIYYRKNEKLNEVLGTFGGIVNIFFILGKIVCYSYNLLVLKHQLINISFENLENSNKKALSDSDSEDISKTQNPDKNFEFSIFSILCPKFVKETVYEQALINLYEYMDINNIITRLQDVDKLKLVLLDENQRKVFDTLPKPGIMGKSSLMKKPSSLFTMEWITRCKKGKFRRRSRRKYQFLLNGDPINKRLFNMIDPTIKLELKQMNENKKTTINSPESLICFNSPSSGILRPKRNLEKKVESEELEISIPEENTFRTELDNLKHIKHDSSLN